MRAAAQMPEVEFLIVGGRERDNALWREMARQSGAANFGMEGFVAQREVSLSFLPLMFWSCLIRPGLP